MNKEQVVILIEGTEKSGKSNIVEAISNTLCIPSFKSELEHQRLRSAFSDNVDLFHQAFKIDQPFLLSLLRQTKYSLIQDRSYVSQWVYSRVFKDIGRVFDEDLLREADLAYKDLGAKIVICTRKSFKGKTDEILDQKYFKGIQDEYLKFVNWTKCETMILDVSDENLKSQIGKITDFVLKEESNV